MTQITLEDLKARCDFDRSEQAVRAAVGSALADGESLLRFLGRYISWNGFFGSGVAELASKIGARLQYPFWTRDWQKMNEPLFAALKLEKLVMGIILTFIVAVASMNIISTLIMLVIEKRREIAIMKAMGASRFDLMKLFIGKRFVV